MGRRRDELADEPMLFDGGAGARGARNEYALEEAVSRLVPGWNSEFMDCELGIAGGAMLLAREEGVKPLLCIIGYVGPYEEG
jgi:hypothetical protein